MKKLHELYSKGPVANRLAGKVALITGAGSGQGQAVSLLFARAGATVIASDVSAEGMAATVGLAAAEGLTVEAATVDATNMDSVKSWIDGAAARHGGIDVLYNNGAKVHMAPFAELTLSQWQETLCGELDVVFIPSQAVWPHMIARGGGSIINISSVSGMRGSEIIGAAAHAAAKGGVIAFTRQLAVEGAPHWIRVNTISPGTILTPPTRAFYEINEDFRRAFDGWPLLARSGVPSDIAYTGLFLASDESSYLTGINIPVDGGWSSKGGFTPHG